MNFGSLTFNSAGAVTVAEDSSTLLMGASTADSLTLSSTGGNYERRHGESKRDQQCALHWYLDRAGQPSRRPAELRLLDIQLGGSGDGGEDSSTLLVGTSTADSLTLGLWPGSPTRRRPA